MGLEVMRPESNCASSELWTARASLVDIVVLGIEGAAVPHVAEEREDDPEATIAEDVAEGETAVEEPSEAVEEVTPEPVVEAAPEADGAATE